MYNSGTLTFDISIGNICIYLCLAHVWLLRLLFLCIFYVICIHVMLLVFCIWALSRFLWDLCYHDIYDMHGKCNWMPCSSTVKTCYNIRCCLSFSWSDSSRLVFTNYVIGHNHLFIYSSSSLPCIWFISRWNFTTLYFHVYVYVLCPKLYSKVIFIYKCIRDIIHDKTLDLYME